jgi:hypothetical protein
MFAVSFVTFHGKSNVLATLMLAVPLHEAIPVTPKLNSLRNLPLTGLAANDCTHSRVFAVLPAAVPPNNGVLLPAR